MSLFARGNIIVALLAIPAGVALATWLAPWQYQCRAVLAVRPAAASLPSEMSLTPQQRAAECLARQRAVLRSGDVAAMALMRLDGIDPAADGPTDGRNRAWYPADQVHQFSRENAARLNRVCRQIKVESPHHAPPASGMLTVTVAWTEDRAGAGRLGKDSRALAAGQAEDFCRFLVEAYVFRRGEIRVEQARQEAAATAAALAVAEHDLALARGDYGPPETEATAAQTELCLRLRDQAQRCELVAASAGLDSGVTVLSEPLPPDPNRPHRPIIWLNLALGLLGGVVAAGAWGLVGRRRRVGAASAPTRPQCHVEDNDREG